MLFYAALLIVTTLTSVGLVAAWAATSPRHWFVRTMAFLGVAALPLLIPAYELFVAFTLQGAVVAAGVQAWRWLNRRHAGEAPRGSRFSLRDALLVVIPLAVVCGVATRLPTLNASTWLSVTGIGVGAGLNELLVLWCVGSDRFWWWLRLPIALSGAVLITLPAALWDWTLDAVVMSAGWPPEDVGTYLSFMGQEDHKRSWLQIGAAFAGLLLLFAWLYRPSSYPGFQRLASAVRWPFVLFVIAAPLGALWLLTHPLPIPKYSDPFPNGRDEYRKAASLVPDNSLVDRLADVDTATLPQLVAAVDEVAPLLDYVYRGSQQDVWQTPVYTADRLSENIAEFRSLARALEARGKLAERRSDSQGAAIEYLACVRFGESLTRGGLMIDALIGIACSNMGIRRLHEIKDQLPAESLTLAIRELSEAENLLDEFEPIVYRDRVWSQQVYGWTGHLSEGLARLTGEDQFDSFASFDDIYRLHVALLRLLRAELAVCHYVEATGRSPNSLAELAAGPFSGMPIDPFSQAGASIRYRRTSTGYRVYSVGPDGVDDGGEAPGSDEYGGISWFDGSSGDLNLEVYFGAIYPSTAASADQARYVDSDLDESSTPANAPAAALSAPQ